MTGRRPIRKKLPIWLILTAGVLMGLAAFSFIQLRPAMTRSAAIMSWIRNPQQYSQWSIAALEHCGNAPFLFPTDGLVGYLWDDSFHPGHRDQGIDIFSGTKPGITPVYAAYDGYLSREPDWKSSLIIRVPDDPLMPGRQIWLYYTHLADPDGNSFIPINSSPGTYEKPVKAGDLLGCQGNYSADSANPVGVHLHFSIVKDDGNGGYLNELEIQNTLDPSAYLGLELNSHVASSQPPVCAGTE
ncbi:MAG: hypothetical protein C0391_07145 [Anaerolinea sp.]|nr:hypothetical protein [Anaerolinea sp.]